jgi:mannose-6-phosphate isomerase-like protein (cupin superfamily)
MTDKAKPEVWTSERCFISELINDHAWPEFSLAHTRVEPGVTTQLHALSVHEVYVIESGTGLMTVGDSAPFPVGPGEIVTIPKHVAQRIQNTGPTDLLFICVCTPRFSRECYTSLE